MQWESSASIARTPTATTGRRLKGFSDIWQEREGWEYYTGEGEDAKDSATPIGEAALTGDQPVVMCLC